jgi:hypothetical protein
MFDQERAIVDFIVEDAELQSDPVCMHWVTLFYDDGERLRKKMYGPAIYKMQSRFGRTTEHFEQYEIRYKRE